MLMYLLIYNIYWRYVYQMHVSHDTYWCNRACIALHMLMYSLMRVSHINKSCWMYSLMFVCDTRVMRYSHIETILDVLVHVYMWYTCNVTHACNVIHAYRCTYWWHTHIDVHIDVLVNVYMWYTCNAIHEYRCTYWWHTHIDVRIDAHQYVCITLHVQHM